MNLKATYCQCHNSKSDNYYSNKLPGIPAALPQEFLQKNLPKQGGGIIRLLFIYRVIQVNHSLLIYPVNLND